MKHKDYSQIFNTIFYILLFTEFCKGPKPHKMN